MRIRARRAKVVVRLVPRDLPMLSKMLMFTDSASGRSMLRATFSRIRSKITMVSLTL